MSDSGSEDQELVDWVFYRDRPEWKDVVPIPQDDGPNPIVAIAYSDKFRDVYDYFRGILATNEMSERALELTKDALALNAANYTVWQYRRRILQELKKDLKEELKFAKEIIEDNPKNYQVWHHRMVIVQMSNDPSIELKFIADMLKEDPKNYHAWQYRQWVLRKYKLFDNELEYTDKLLKEDIRNNSAWNHRYYVINHTTDFSEEAVQKEVDYALEAIGRVRKNESSWNYLQGLLIHAEKGLLEPRVIEFCESLYASGERSPHLLAFLVDVAVEKKIANSETAEDDIERGIQVNNNKTFHVVLPHLYL
ncbi:hypothetical protein AAG570_005651 [Ranatra chinensis]|uniref:Protein farnesyltransferase/geranylgeranyltransferase type-1 subunit alpha n=1 Tax=Ranatra chinensis TaxID=642074 RepID=A0ABD0XY22_9HEMI